VQHTTRPELASRRHDDGRTTLKHTTDVLQGMPTPPTTTMEVTEVGGVQNRDPR